MRAVLRDQLARAADIQVVGEAADPYEAREQILRLAPDVITLDIEMPRMDGLSFLARLMRHYPIPVVVVSSLANSNNDAAQRARSLGAADVIAKPDASQSPKAQRETLVRALRAAATKAPRVIAIGASTGGPGAIERVLSAMPAETPPIVIVQHMPAGFTSAFARRLDERCTLRVREARDGEPLEAGTALIAPGGRHTTVMRHEGKLHVAVREGPSVHFQRPSVDVLFNSVANAVGARAVAVLLTGMGADGASGMRTLREMGAHTIAQDEETSVVFSMPGEAIRFGAACEVLPLPRIAAAAMKAVSA